MQWAVIKKIKYVDQISKAKFIEYREYLLSDGLQKVSVNAAQRHLSAIFSYAVDKEYIEFNPLKQIKKYKTESESPRYLSKEEIDTLVILAKEYSTIIYIVVALGIYAGFWRYEIANARWEWFDFENDMILIQLYNNFIPKSHRSRPIPFNLKLKDILTSYKKDEGYLLESDYPEEQRTKLVRYDFKNSFNKLKNMLDWNG